MLKRGARPYPIGLSALQILRRRYARRMVKDVVEVSSQAVRSTKWNWIRDLCRHIIGREKRLATEARPTRFLAGAAADLNRILRVSRFKEIRPEILIVQP